MQSEYLAPAAQRTEVQLGDAVIESARRSIDFGRAFQSESFMGTLKIEVLDEGVELGLLLQDVLAGRSGSFLLQGQVHAFMASVLLRGPLHRFWPKCDKITKPNSCVTKRIREVHR